MPKTQGSGEAPGQGSDVVRIDKEAPEKLDNQTSQVRRQDKGKQIALDGNKEPSVRPRQNAALSIREPVPNQVQLMQRVKAGQADKQASDQGAVIVSKISLAPSSSGQQGGSQGVVLVSDSVADRTVDVVQENISDKTKESSAGKEVAGLVDGVFTDPDSDSGSPIETSNPFAQLTDIGDVEDIVPRRLSSPSQSAPARSPRGIDGGSVQPVIFRQRSAGSVQELTASFQQMKEFNAEIGQRMQRLSMVDDVPRAAIIDAKDVQLLNKLGNKGRPANYGKKFSKFHAQATSSLVRND